MHLLKYGGVDGQQPRGTWRPFTQHGKRTVAVMCPACGRRFTLFNHRVDLDGLVTEKVICPFREPGWCTLRNADFVLLGWADFWRKRPN